MNKKQKIVFLVGIGLIVLMGLIVPWYYVVHETDQRPKKIDVGYGFLFSPPSPNAALSKIGKEVMHLLRQGKSDEAVAKLKEVVRGKKVDVDTAADWFTDINKGLFEIPYIDFSRLLVQWVIVAIATAGIVLVLKDDTGR